MLNRRIGRQPSAGARKIQAIGPPRGAAGQLEDFSAISPDAEISPYWRPIDLQAGFRHPSLRDIILAMDEESAQARPPDGGAREEPPSCESMQRLEREVLLSLRQCVDVFAPDEMSLRHMLHYASPCP